MFVMMDRDEVLRFKTIPEIEDYLWQTAARGYAAKVIEWAESEDQTLSIPNGPTSVDIWFKTV